ncbi:MAG: hypothetical protein ACLTDX_07575 [[Clostridium] innocuum]
MRRTDRETTREEAWRIFDQSAYSVLSMSYRDRPLCHCTIRDTDG